MMKNFVIDYGSCEKIYIPYKIILKTAPKKPSLINIFVFTKIE